MVKLLKFFPSKIVRVSFTRFDWMSTGLNFLFLRHDSSEVLWGQGYLWFVIRQRVSPVFVRSFAHPSVHPSFLDSKSACVLRRRLARAIDGPTRRVRVRLSSSLVSSSSSYKSLYHIVARVSNDRIISTNVGPRRRTTTARSTRPKRRRRRRRRRRFRESLNEIRDRRTSVDAS